jgi:DNA primase large subunit
MTIIDYSYYPILKGSLSHHIKSFDEQEILYAFEHIEKYTPTKLLDLDLSVWLISMIMLRCLNNSYLTRKFVSNYGKYTFESKCLKDFLNREVRMEILEYFGIFKDVLFETVQKEPFVKIHCTDYLELLEQGLSIQAPQYNLVNQTLHKGHVLLEYQRFIYLLRLSLEQRLIKKIQSMKDFKENELINRCVKELDERYPRFDKQQVPSKENIPYSIQELIDKAYRDSNLSHRERLRLGLYLLRNNFEWEYILDIFKALSDFDLRTTTYQLNSLKKYIK